MTTAARPNFFILLGLNPDADWNQAAFEQTLRQKRVEWSRQGAGVAKKALAARQNLALLPAITEVMASPELRKKEAQVARKELASARKADIERFEKQLALMNARDSVDQAEIEQFVDAFKFLFTPAEIRQRITAPLSAPGSATTTTRPQLDKSLVTSISDRLHILHMGTLYELLQRNRKTATPELRRAAEALYTLVVRLPPSAEATARIELAGLSRQVFQSDAMRAEYDENLRQASLTRHFQELDESMGHSTNKELHQKQVSLFIDNARKEGWQAQEAVEKLKEHARQKKWTVTIPALDLDSERPLCPNCETFNNKNQRYCTICKQALYIECPRCKEQVSCEYPVCGNCGFAVGNRYLVDSLLEELKGLLKTGQAEQAQQVASEAEASWRLSPDRQDYRSQQIIASKAQIRRLLVAHKQAQKDALERLRELIIDEVVLDKQRFIQVAWAPPEEGKVVIVKSSQPLQQAGQVLAEAEAGRLGRLLAKVDLADLALDQWEPGAVTYYTPVILLQQKAYAGSSQRYVCVENVSQIGYQNLGSAIRLHWTWPPNCQEVLISYRSASCPWQHEPRTTKLPLSREEYERLGYYEIREVVSQDHEIGVSAIMKLGGEQVVAREARILVRTLSKIVITYEIKPPTLLRKQRVLHLMIDKAQALPALLLVSKRGGLPLRKTDGDLFYRIETTVTDRQKVVFELPDRPLPPKTFGKLFFEDDTKYSEFIVHHPCMDQMRLS